MHQNTQFKHGVIVYREPVGLEIKLEMAGVVF